MENMDPKLKETSVNRQGNQCIKRKKGVSRKSQIKGQQHTSYRWGADHPVTAVMPGYQA